MGVRDAFPTGEVDPSARVVEGCTPIHDSEPRAGAIIVAVGPLAVAVLGLERGEDGAEGTPAVPNCQAEVLSL